MLIVGDHTFSPMTGRPLQDDSSVAPASQAARVSVAMTSAMPRARDVFHAHPKFTCESGANAKYVKMLHHMQRSARSPVGRSASHSLGS